MGDSCVPLIVMQMMCKYHRHSILHLYCLYFFRLCLRIENLRESLFTKFGILDFVQVKATPEWNKSPADRLSYSGSLALLVDAIHRLDFSDFVCDAMANNATWNEFENTLYCKYLSEVE